MTITARLLLVDDNQDAVDSVRKSVEGEADMEVVGEANSAEDAIALLVDAQPTIVIMDITASPTCRESRPLGRCSKTSLT